MHGRSLVRYIPEVRPRKQRLLEFFVDVSVLPKYKLCPYAILGKVWCARIYFCPCILSASRSLKGFCHFRRVLNRHWSLSLFNLCSRGFSRISRNVRTKVLWSHNTFSNRAHIGGLLKHTFSNIAYHYQNKVLQNSALEFFWDEEAKCYQSFEPMKIAYDQYILNIFNKV